MDKRISQILGASKSKVSVNTDIYSNISFDSSQKLLPNNDINHVLDITNQFNIERQSCTFYRLVGKINPIISNTLFNITGDNSWSIFNQPEFTTLGLSYTALTYTQSIAKNLKEIEGWYGYFNTGLTQTSLCHFNDMEPKRERFSFTPDITNNSVKNWDLTITYPYTADTTHNLISGGLLICDSIPVIVGGKPMTALYVPVLHNLSIGDSIILTGTTLDGTYDIKRVGLDDGKMKNNFLCVDIEFSSVTIHSNSRMIKLYNNVPSQYYFRKFKKINTKSGNLIQPDDYEIYKLGFSENIFADDIVQYVFNEDIDVNNLVDNLGRPINEIYLTTIKTDSNGIFTNISSGLEVPFIDNFNQITRFPHISDIPAIQKVHGVSTYPTQSFKALELDVNIDNEDFYGDVVEYNSTTLEEVVLSKVNYRFNTINRETATGSVAFGPRPEGYYYEAHNLIKIRDFSSYIEQGDISTAGMPDYTENLGDGRYLWRDLLDIGVIDINKPILNYPFLNGAHYIYQNYDFSLKRQDAFDDWELYYKIFPSDPIGDIMSADFKINSSDNVC